MSSNVKQSITKLVPLLERLSLVRINQDALDRVIRCVEFSKQIDEIDHLDNIKPMISPIDDDVDDKHCIFMRDDLCKPTDRNEIVKNSHKMIEDYFITSSIHKHYGDL